MLAAATGAAATGAAATGAAATGAAAREQQPCVSNSYGSSSHVNNSYGSSSHGLSRHPRGPAGTAAATAGAAMWTAAMWGAAVGTTATGAAATGAAPMGAAARKQKPVLCNYAIFYLFLCTYDAYRIIDESITEIEQLFFTHLTYLLSNLAIRKSIDLSIPNLGEKLSNYRYRSLGKCKECPPLVTSASRLYW